MESETRKLALKHAKEGKDPFRANAKADPLQSKLVELEAEADKLAQAGEAKRMQLRADPSNEELRRQVRRENQRIADIQNQRAIVAEALSIAMGGNQHRVPPTPEGQ